MKELMADCENKNIIMLKWTKGTLDMEELTLMMNDLDKLLADYKPPAIGLITVRQALNELDTWEIESRFQLTEHKDSQEQSISIIQDFKSVLNKVSALSI